MFCVEDQDGNRHSFYSERYAKGFLRSVYDRKLREMKANPERYDIQGKALSDTEFRISVKDRSRLYFLGRLSDVKNVVYFARIKRRIRGAERYGS